nr:putative pentatricopeptide repeat-containing protein At5g47460 [Ipomoea batatas]
MQRSVFFESTKKHLTALVNREQNKHLLSKNICSSNIPLENHFKLWSSVIPSLAQGRFGSETALLEASQIQKSGSEPTIHTLVHLIRGCANLGRFSHGEQLHCHVLKSGYVSDVFVSTSLINFYVKFEAVGDAHRLFVEISEPSVVSWNALISGYVRCGKFNKALNLFVQLERSGLCADSYSFTASLSACRQPGLLHFGESIHSKIVRLGVECSVVVGNSLIDMYGKCGCAKESIRVFNGMTDRDTISWNSVIAANARNGRLEQAFRFLHQMPDPDTISYNELISGIAQFGEIQDAIDLLSRIPNPNSSSWNSIITWYVNRGRACQALEFFCKMHFSGIQMDQFTFSSILSGTANVADITWGRLIHCCTVKHGLDRSIVVGSALIDMYSKCGKVNQAEVLFETLPRKNLVTWNAMISGHAHNGNSIKVLGLFEQLKMVTDFQPDGITFLNVLAACWHNKMPLQVANGYFESMIKDYGISPTAEHCSCMIRLMGQEGEVSGAEKMIKELGFEKCALVWRALLGACVTCGDIKVAEVAAEKVIGLEGHNVDFVYVLLSNVYASHEKWKEVKGTRTLMKERRVMKASGHSWIEVK